MQGILFALYAWNAGPVDGTDITISVVDINREFPFIIDLSPARSREGTSEGQKTLYHFESESPLLFIKQELFNILVYERRLRRREIHSKVKIMREFDTGDLLVVSKQVK